MQERIRLLAASFALFALSILSNQAATPASIKTVTVKLDGSVELTISGEPNSWFYVEATSDLKSWETTEEPSLRGGNLIRFYNLDDQGRATVIDLTARSKGMRFYRIQRMDFPTIEEYHGPLVY